MADLKDNEKFVLSFKQRRDPSQHSAPAIAVADAVRGMQRLVHLLAMRREGHIPGKRIRASVDVQERYQLVVLPARQGTLSVPVDIRGAHLLQPVDIESVLNSVNSVLKSVSEGDDQNLEEEISDPTWRRYALEAIESIVPKSVHGVDLDIALPSGAISLDEDFIGFAESQLRGSRSVDRSAVVGTLQSIHFEKKSITIRHKSSGRELRCVYDDTVEDSLLEHPRDLVLVWGIVTRNENGSIAGIQRVDHIEHVDLTPYRLPSPKGYVLSGKHNRIPHIDVSISEEDGLYHAEYERFGIEAFGSTREELETSIDEEIDFLWRHYALASDDELTSRAKRLKDVLILDYSEVVDASKA